MNEVTRILSAMADGDGRAAHQLLPLVYEELRKVAAARMANEAVGHTLQPTALVHEAWLRLAGNDADVSYANRAHFFRAAAEAMRRILIDRARKKLAVRHGGGHQRVAFEEAELAAVVDEDHLLAVNEALEAFTAHDPRMAELVKLRHFAGLTIEEAATVLGISDRTAKRDWAYARAWLYRQITKS